MRQADGLAASAQKSCHRDAGSHTEVGNELAMGLEIALCSSGGPGLDSSTHLVAPSHLEIWL